MGEENFAEFVRRKADPIRSPDWSAKRDAWLSRLNDLYVRVEGYLADFVRQGLIQIERRTVELHEEYIGAYRAETLSIRLGTNVVTLRPIGTLLVASAGRADLEGPSGTARIVLVPREVEEFKVTVHSGADAEKAREPEAEPEWTWKLVLYRPHMQYVDLTETSFQQALMAVANG